MATKQPPRGQPRSATEPMVRDRLARVLGAGRREATGAWQQRRDRGLVHSDDQQSGSSERGQAGPPICNAIASSALRTSRTSASNGRVSAGRRATITMSARGGDPPRAARYASRRRRRTRFRRTAPRICRLTANPTRRPGSFSFHSTISDGRSTRAPSWNTAWKSFPPVSRSRLRSRPAALAFSPTRRSAASVLSLAAASGPFGRPASSSAPGSRGSSSAGAGSAGTCVS